MTVWFVIPADREATFRALYADEQVRGSDNPSEDETVGRMILDTTGTKLMTGTTRMSDAVRRALDGRKPAWLEIHLEFPPPTSWEKPTSQ